MHQRTTFTYYKVSNERLHASLLSKDKGSDIDVLLLTTDKVMEEIRDQIERILQDDRIGGESVIITIEAGKQAEL